MTDRSYPLPGVPKAPALLESSPQGDIGQFDSKRWDVASDVVTAALMRFDIEAVGVGARLGLRFPRLQVPCP